MSKTIQYYLGRIHKAGQINDETLVDTIREPTFYKTKRATWTFTDTDLKASEHGVIYIFSKLSKYNPEGTVKVINEQLYTQDERDEPNLLIASSPFLYIPEFSGIAYQVIKNQISHNAFSTSFRGIIRDKYGGFFAEAEVQPITDIEKFYKRIIMLTKIFEIQAKVNPPNPLFGRAWKSLRDYLKKRSLNQLDIKEKGEKENPIATNVSKYISDMLNEENKTLEDSNVPDITDAAILMAADGYGTAKIVGSSGKTKQIISTFDNQNSFFIDSEASPEEIYEEAHKQFSRINKERDMGH